MRDINKATVKVESSNIRNGVEKQVEEKVRGNKKRAQKVKFDQGYVRPNTGDGNMEISSLYEKAGN